MMSFFKNIFSRKNRSVWGKAYKHLPIKSDYRAHDVAFELIKNRIGTKKTIDVLDIATGTGAFTQRITDNFPGWKIEINDYENQALITNYKKYNVDLNSFFSSSFSSEGYDLIIALEIIEHIENPWNFIREIKKLLRKDGVLILSTPNVDSTLDRLIYLINGHPQYFGETGYTNSGGHITQVPDWLLKLIVQNSGYSNIELCSDIDTSPHIGIIAYLKLLFLMPFSRFYMRNRNNRSINIYVCN